MTKSVIPTETLVHRDAIEFGAHVRAGGWRLGLLVARNVFTGRPSNKANEGLVLVGKVSTSAFAKQAGIDQKTVQRYQAAWDLAAESGLVKRSADLVPGDELSVEALPAWSLFTQPQEEPTDSELHGTKPKAKPEARGRRTGTAAKKKLEDPYVEFKIQKYVLVIRSLDGSPLPDDDSQVLELVDELRSSIAKRIKEES